MLCFFPRSLCIVSWDETGWNLRLTSHFQFIIIQCYALRVWSLAKGNYIVFAKYGALMAVILKFTVFWDATTCGLNFQGILPMASGKKMEEICSSTATEYQTTEYHITEDSNVYCLCWNTSVVILIGVLTKQVSLNSNTPDLYFGVVILAWDTSLFDWALSWFSSVPLCKCCDSTSSCFSHILSDSLFVNHLTI